MSSSPSHPATGRPSWLKIGRQVIGRAGLWTGNLVDTLFPPTCAFCLSDIREFTDLREKMEAMLCGGCRERLFPVYELACGRCGYPAPPGGRATPAEGCPHCATKRFRFEGAVAMGVYRGSLQTALLRMKHRRGRTLAAAVGRWMALRLGDQLSDFRPDFVVPIPARLRRRITRGVNSPEILARRLARQLQIPVFQDLLRWQRRVERQHTLLPTERYQNVNGALAISRGYDIREARVLLVDDILTTGATANEATRVLSKAGATRVCVAVVARVADR